jgi:hypothetical protein
VRFAFLIARSISFLCCSRRSWPPRSSIILSKLLTVIFFTSAYEKAALQNPSAASRKPGMRFLPHHLLRYRVVLLFFADDLVERSRETEDRQRDLVSAEAVGTLPAISLWVFVASLDACLQQNLLPPVYVRFILPERARYGAGSELC